MTMDIPDFLSALERAGGSDRAARVAELEQHLSPALAPLARVAYNYLWSWLPDGEAVFREINPLRWENTGRQPRSLPL